MNRKEKKARRLEKALEDQTIKDSEMTADTHALAKLAEKGLSVAKRKQIFKKHKAKDLKAQIAELRVKSQKLNKKDTKQKAEKGKIAKQIKELKKSIKRSGIQDGEDDSDESE